MHWRPLTEGRRFRALVPVVLIALGVVACSQQGDRALVPAIDDRSFALVPATVPVKASVLVGELRDLRVTERIERESGKVVYGPQLQGTLQLKNDSEDQTVRLIAGTVSFTDRQGQPIRLAEGRGETGFRFYSYQSDGLGPGAETTHNLDVPFPAAALGEHPLGDLRLELTYIPLPYREETVRVPVALAP